MSKYVLKISLFTSILPKALSTTNNCGYSLIMPHKETPARSWHRRVWRLTHERFPLYPNVVLLLLQFAIIFTIVYRFFSIPAFEFPLTDFIFGSISSVLFVYLLRVFDELKDYKTDLIDFPDRPLAAGLISHRDIKILWIAVTALLFILQIPFLDRPYVLTAFAVIMVYSFLAFRWFFLEKYIRPSLPLALLTHNPIVYLYSFYTISFFAPNIGGYITSVILLIVGDTMATTAWELSRKIRGTKEEDSYTTYSKIWGTTLSSLMPLLFICGSWSATLYALLIYYPNQSTYLIWTVPLIPILIYFFQFIKFLRNPTKAPPFRETVEFFKLSLFVAYALFIWL